MYDTMIFLKVQNEATKKYMHTHCFFCFTFIYVHSLTHAIQSIQ